METVQEPKAKKKRAPRKKTIKVEDKIVTLTPPEPAKITAEPELKLTLEDKCPRSPLCEGRNYGIGFALCKREGDTAKTVGPISPCKDYMNDQVYSEHTGKPYSAWGYKANKCDIFTDGHGYIAMAVLEYKGGGKHSSFDKEEKFFADSYPMIQAFVNIVEDALKLDKKTKIVVGGDKRYIAQVPMFWVEFPYRVSLWALMVRFALESYWVAGDPFECMKKCRTGDCGYIANALPKLKKMIEGNRPSQDYTKTGGWHDAGIVSINF